MGDPQPKTMAELVNDLFQTYRHPNGREYTNKEVARVICSKGRHIDASHLSRIRTGHVVNPGVSVIEALCLFFPIDPAYFFPGLQQRQADTPLSADPIHIALRSVGLQPDVQEKLEDLIRILKYQDQKQDG